MNKRMLKIAAFGAACLLAGSGIGAALNSGATAENTTVTTVVTSPFTAAVAQVKDSVVGVSNYQLVRYSNSGYNDWGSFFGFGYGYGDGYGRGNQPDTTQEVKASSGSGVVIAKEYVLTNNHVVDGASSLKVAILDENGGMKEYAAVLVANDANVDIAILYVPDLPINPVTLGDSDSLQVGDWAICIGNPLRDEFFGTVTAGIVSALNRNVSSTSYDRYGRRETITNTMIQVDADINNGNSGGGMFSASGELMGIPTLKYSGTVLSGASIDGINMCIPINAAKPLINDVLSGKITTPAVQQTDSSTSSSGSQSSGGLVGKPRLGVSIKGINSSSTLVRSGVLPNGVYVDAVDAGSPAELAGVQAGDIIVDCENNVITSVSQLQNILAGHKEGDTVSLKVYRVEGLSDVLNGYASPSTLGTGSYLDLQVTLAIVDAVFQ